MSNNVENLEEHRINKEKQEALQDMAQLEAFIDQLPDWTIEQAMQRTYDNQKCTIAIRNGLLNVLWASENDKLVIVPLHAIKKAFETMEDGPDKECLLQALEMDINFPDKTNIDTPV